MAFSVHMDTKALEWRYLTESLQLPALKLEARVGIGLKMTLPVV
jgi:hypothetical protein